MPLLSLSRRSVVTDLNYGSMERFELSDWLAQEYKAKLSSRLATERLAVLEEP